MKVTPATFRNARRRAPAIGAVVALAMMTGCGGDSSDSSVAAGEGGDGGGAVTLKVGAMFDQSGPFASLGREQRQGFEMALEELNAQGDVKLEATIEDSQTQPDKAVEIARQFLTKDVDVIFGPTSAAACQAVQQVTERAGVATYCYSGGPIEFTDHVFSGEYGPVEGLANIPLAFMRDQGWKRIACLKTADASGEAYSAPLKEQAPKYGLEVVAEETFQPGATDVVSQLTKIRAANPDVIYACASGANLVPVTRGVVQLGMEQPVFAGLGSVLLEVVDAVKSYVPKGGLYSNGSWVMLPDSVPDDYPGKDLVQSFVSDFEAKAGKKPSILAGDTVDSVRLMAEAIKRADAAGEVSGTTIAAELEKITEFPGIISTYNFAPDRHRGTTAPPVIAEWTKDGTVKLAATLDSTEP